MATKLNLQDVNNLIEETEEQELSDFRDDTLYHEIQLDELEEEEW